MVIAGSGLLAHQGNWDEILMFVLPILIAFGGVRWVERRARRGTSDEDEATVKTRRSRSDGDQQD